MDQNIDIKTAQNNNLGLEKSQLISDNIGTLQNKETTRKIQGVVGRFSKTDSRYWLIGKRLFKWSGSTTYSINIQYRNARKSFPTGSPNKEMAAKIAAKIFQDIVQFGLKAVVENFRPSKPKADRIATVGEWIAAAKSVSTVNEKTFNCYAASLRLIVGEIKNIKKTRSRYGPSNGGAKKYRESIDIQALSVLSQDAILKWQISYVKNTKKGNSTKKSRIASCNSTIRQARSLFCKKITKHVREFTLPNPHPFYEVELYTKQSTKYKCIFEHSTLLKKAQSELCSEKPMAFLVIILALGAGLRKSEIDRLVWKDVNISDKCINVDGSKTAGSSAPVYIDDNVASILDKYKSISKGAFVLESSNKKWGFKTWGYQYRASNAFDDAISWLRDSGINTQKPIHELRKEFGSLVNSKYGLYAASVVLRHSTTAITADHYIDLKEKPIVNIGECLDLKTEVSRKD